MRFTKMHGAGNSYVYVDCITGEVPKDPAKAAVLAARPHFGIGGDGLILIEPSSVADAKMRIFNADGSEGMMCGNGVRCVGKYLYDSGIARRGEIFVETRSGVKALQMIVEDNTAIGARVDMGAPVLQAHQIPVIAEGPTVVNESISAAGERFFLTCVSMGNPHAVLIVDEMPGDDLFIQAGRAIEAMERFPERVNVEFARVAGDNEIHVRVWERGSGATLACGTGACAALVACVLNGKTSRTADVHLPGGALTIEWAENGHVYMTGPAVTVFTGEIDL